MTVTTMLADGVLVYGLAVLRDGTAVEHATAQPPLRPGQKGQHTNGPAAHWVRRAGGPWLLVDCANDAICRGRVSLRHIKVAAEVCDTWDEFVDLVVAKNDGVDDAR